MSGEPEKLDKTGERDKEGKFVTGHKGMGGRPKGLSIVALLKKALEEVPEGEKMTYAEALVKIVLKKALTDEDKDMIRDIINRVDGMPKQSIEHGVDDTVEEIKVEIVKNETKS